MAITWSEKNFEEYNAGRPCWHETGNVTHVGLVISTFVQCDRVMSDIYSDERYALVWNPEKGESEAVHVGGAFECNARHGKVEIDIKPAYLAAHEAKEEADRKAREEEERERAVKLSAERAEQERNRPVRGKLMQVVRGRKVPKGTIGRVFGIGEGRVGLALSNEKNERGQHKDVAWVNAEYLESVETEDAA